MRKVCFRGGGANQKLIKMNGLEDIGQLVIAKGDFGVFRP